MSAGRLGTRPRIEVWFDPICPWAYLGERRLQRALEDTGLVEDVDVVWRSFELDPVASRQAGRTATQVMVDAGAEPEELAVRWQRVHQLAASAGIAIDMDAARPVNTHDAHRLVHLARTRGAGSAVVRRLFHAHHGELRNIADATVLQQIGAENGISASEVAAVIAGQRFSAEVRAERARAAELGVRGVPTAVLDGEVTLPLLRHEQDLSAALTSAFAGHHRRNGSPPMGESSCHPGGTRRS